MRNSIIKKPAVFYIAGFVCANCCTILKQVSLAYLCCRCFIIAGILQFIKIAPYLLSTFFALVTDLYSKKIMGYKLDNNMKVGMVKDALKWL